MALTTTTSGGGSTTSFTKAPQANGDWYAYNENELLALTRIYNNTTNILTLDVMANDLGGNAKKLYSVDDGGVRSCRTC